ncbi:MAG: redox-regulated ATPase YchF [Candidatus Moranbacteria bacterium]|jgi:GTP-binding protein YchF|nr:redox-regulated ATPase YchF [Candidatus Moranbacteria bacterium]
MKIGIVGLPNVGKSTLFKALTKIQVDINNYPFCTIKPNVGVVKVPDERVDKLAELSQSEKKIYATIEFVDIAGLVKGASKGEGLGNKFLHNIREVDAIVQVVRVFENKNIAHVHETVNPKRDIDIINTELILADMETVKNRLAKISKEARADDKKATRKKELIEKLQGIINENSLEKIRNFIISLGEDFELIKDLSLLSFKPILYALNTDKPEKTKDIIAGCRLPVADYVGLDIKTEEDLLEFSDEEKTELELKSDLSQLIKKSYQMLELITYLTTGKPETRAWTIPKNSTAPRAGRAIHGDFEQKFICAEIVSYKDLIKCGSKIKAKELGLLRIEGKNYIVQDGDVIEFKI